MRSYQLTCTGSHQNSEVKRVWARVVLGWVTSWEVLVLHPFFSVFFFFSFSRPLTRSNCRGRLLSVAFFVWLFFFFHDPAAMDRLKSQGETRSSGIREEGLGEPEGLFDKLERQNITEFSKTAKK